MKLEEFKQLKVEQSGLIRHDVPVMSEERPSIEAIPELKSNLHFGIVTSVEDPLKVIGVLSSTEGISVSYDFLELGHGKGQSSQRDRKIGEIANKNVVSIKPDQTLDDLRSLIKDTKKKILPVVDGNGKYLGIVTAKDLRDKLLSEVKIRF